MAGTVAKRIGGRLYGVTLADGSTHRFHANQKRPRFTQTTDDDFTVFSDAFNLPVHRPQFSNVETGYVDNTKYFASCYIVLSQDVTCSSVDFLRDLQRN
jgi:hypothetical protein